MNILSLNCRGLGNPSAVTGLCDLVRREAPAAIFLCETKLSIREMDKITEKIEGYVGLAVDSAGRSGGLAFLWRRELVCELRSMTIHYMDFTINVGVRPWRITGFYGWPEVSNHHLSWSLLRTLAQQSDDPWLCIGDFNEVMYATEMKGGERPQRQMMDFCDAISSCGLRDLGFVGYTFTYENGQAKPGNRQSRLDRALISKAWAELFPDAMLINMDRDWSDHAPIRVLLERMGVATRRRNKLFRFEQIWVDEE